MLGGVAGGVAQTYGLDVALVRIGFVLAAFLGGLGVLLYAVAWIVIPDEGADAVSAEPTDLHATATQILAFVLVGLGALLVFGRLVPDDGPDVIDFFWPLALVAGGVAILVARVRDDEREPVAETRPSGAPSATTLAAATPGATATTGGAGAAAAPTATDTTDTHTAWSQARPWPSGIPPQPPRPPRPPRPPKPRGFVGPLVISILLLFAGATALLDVTDVVDVDAEVALAIALLTVGAGLVASAWFGRARGLVALGLVLTVPLAALAVIDVPFEGGAGERTFHPRRVSELRDEYRLGAGQITLDLRDLTLTGLVDVEASVAFGELQVFVPSDVDVDVDAQAGMGSIDLFGTEVDGVSADLDRSVDGGSGAGTLRLELRAGIGAIEVERYATDGGIILEDAR